MADKPPAVLIADAVALDFLNSSIEISEGQGDFLASGSGLLSWMTQAKLLQASDADRIRNETDADELDAVATEVRALRDWFRRFVTTRMGRPLWPDDLAAAGRLNALLETDDTFTALVPSIDSDGPPIRLRTFRRCQTARSLILVVAESLARFLCEESFVSVKPCEGPGCRFVFADHTRAGTRRWCSMSMCGNRAKQAAHRNRSRWPDGK